jgi:hypothetical protein
MSYLSRDTFYPRAYIFTSNSGALLVESILHETRISLLNASASNSLDPIFHLSASNDLFKIIQTSNDIASFYSKNNTSYLHVYGTVQSKALAFTEPQERQIVFGDQNTHSEFAGIGYDGTNLLFQVPNTNQGISFQAAEGINNHSMIQLNYDSVLQEARIGVGNKYPREALDVYGNIYSTGTIVASNLHVIGNTTVFDTFTCNTEQIVVTNTGNGPALFVTQAGANTIAEFYDDTNIALIIDDGARVGVNTLFPRDTFDVHGNALVTGNIGIGTMYPINSLDVRGSINYTGDIYKNGQLVVLNTFSTWYYDANSNAYNVIGNVGIGTSSPTEKLDVVGNIKYSQQVISTTSSSPPFSIQSTQRVNNLNVEFLDGHSSDFYRNLTNVTAGILPTYQGGTGSNYQTQSKLLVGQGSNNAIISPHELHWDNTNQFLGINQTSPQDRLHLEGNLIVQNSNLASVYVYSPSTNTASYRLYNNTGEATLALDNMLRLWGYSNQPFQLATNNMERLRVQTDGKIGIGTSFPRQLLDIQHGNAIFSNNLGIGTTIPIQPLHVIGQSYFSSNLGIGTTLPRQLLDIQHGNAIFSANLGIGTTIPIQPLHVIGQSYFSTNLGIGTTLPRQLLDIQHGNAIFSNNLGIGTTLPIQPLHVVGQSYFSTNLGIGTTLPRQLLDIQHGNAIFSNNLGIGTTIPIQPLHVVGQSYFTTNLGIGTTLPRQFLDIQGGNIITSANLGIGTTIPIQPLHVVGQSYFTTNLGIGTTLPRQLVDIQGGNLITSGNLGIGTTLPIQPLHVIGQSYFSTNVGIGTTIPIQPLHVIGQSYFSSSMGIGTTIPLQNLDVIGNLITSGNMGVGTTLPILPLHIQGQSYFSNTIGIGTTLARQLLDVQGGNGIISGNLGVGTTLPLARIHANNTTVLDGFRVDNGLSSTTPVIVNSYGNLGIGTDSTRTRVSISPHLLEAKISLWDTTNPANHYGFGISANQLNYHVDATTASHVFYATGKNGNGTELIRFLGTGNVGIGTNLPTQLLDVNGYIRATTGLQFGTNYLVDYTNYIGLDTPAETTRIAVTKATGSVGIGSTQPSQKMHVEGSAYISGNVGIGTTNILGPIDIWRTQTVSGYSDGIIITTNTPDTQTSVTGSAITMRNVPTSRLQPMVTLARISYGALDNTYGDGSYNNGVLQFETANNGTLGKRMIISGTGCVGIGTTLPRQFMDIQGGNTILSGNLGVGTTLPLATTHIYYAGVGDIFRVDDSAAPDSSPFLINQEGNVGIGTITPMMPLHVVGTSYFTSSVGIGTAITRQLLDVQGGNAIVSGNLGIGTVTPFIRFVVNGTSYFSGNVGIGTTSGRELFDVQGGNGIISGNLGIGTTFAIQRVHVVGNEYITGSLGIGTTYPRYSLDIDTNTAIFGNVGIGTTIPRKTLDVQGTTITTNLGVNVLSPTYDLEATGQVMFTGNVGINTTVPFYPLNIYSSDCVLTSYAGKLGISKGVALQPTSEIDISTSATSGTYTGIFLRNNGNVNPSASLRIQSQRFDGNTNSAYAANIGLARYNNNTYQTNQSVLGALHFGGNHTDGTSTNVGYIASIQAIAEQDFTSSSAAGTSLAFYTGSNSYNFTDTSSVNKGYEVQRITPTGRIGIGTTIPFYTHDIRGSQIVTGNVGIGTTIIQTGLTVYHNAYVGSGMNGVYNTYGGGPYYKQKGWDSAGTSHTIAFPEYCVADNSSGTLHIQIKSITSHKMGNVSLSFLKQYSQNVDIFSIYYHKSDDMTTLTVTVAGTDISVTTDSDCAMSWSSIGAC